MFPSFFIGALTQLRIQLLREHGIETSCKTASAALLAAGAIRFKTLRIHLLRQLGYEAAEETASAAHYRSAVLVGSPSP